MRHVCRYADGGRRSLEPGSRRPDYFHGTAVQCEQPEVYVPKQKDEAGLAGVFGAGLRRVFVNGQPRPVRYLSDLRISPSHRSGSLLARGFRFLRREVFKNDEFAQSLVVTENKNALNLLTSGRCGLPGYFQFGDYVLSLIGLRRPPRAAAGPQVHRVRPMMFRRCRRSSTGRRRVNSFSPCTSSPSGAEMIITGTPSWKIFFWPIAAMNWLACSALGIRAATSKPWCGVMAARCGGCGRG